MPSPELAWRLGAGSAHAEHGAPGSIMGLEIYFDTTYLEWPSSRRAEEWSAMPGGRGSGEMLSGWEQGFSLG